MRPRKKINYITLSVEDLERSVNFYFDVFQFEIDEPISDNPDHCLIELDDNFAIVLYQREGFLELTVQESVPTSSTPFMLSHHARSKIEVDLLVANTVQNGGRLIDNPIEDDWGYVALIADPDNHLWEISYTPELEQPKQSAAYPVDLE